MAALLVFLLARFYWHGLAADLSPVPRTEAARLCRLDPRAAGWREISLIPGIGERSARRFAPALARLPAAQWEEISGVGPATARLLRRHLETPLAKD